MSPRGWAGTTGLVSALSFSPGFRAENLEQPRLKTTDLKPERLGITHANGWQKNRVRAG